MNHQRIVINDFRTVIIITESFNKIVHILRKFFIVMLTRNLPTILEFDMPTSRKLSDSYKENLNYQFMVSTKIKT
jgi:hypothetical protein